MIQPISEKYWELEHGRFESDDLHEIFQVKKEALRLNFVKPGVSEIHINGNMKGYVKRTDLLNGFSDFKSENEANRIKIIYQRLTEKGFYHPKTIFSVITKNKISYIQSIQPPLLILEDINEKELIQMDIKLSLLEEIALNNNIFPNNIDTHFENWGYSGQGELYYHDLHLFRL